jgi:hypothetical protein
MLMHHTIPRDLCFFFFFIVIIIIATPSWVVLETLCRCGQVSQMCSSTDLKPTPKSQTSVRLLGFKILRHWLQFWTSRDLGFGALGFEALEFGALRVELLQELRAGRIDGSHHEIHPMKFILWGQWKKIWILENPNPLPLFIQSWFISFLSFVHFHLIMDEVHPMAQSYDNLDLDQTWPNHHTMQIDTETWWSSQLSTLLNPKAYPRQQIWHLYVQVDVPTCIVCHYVAPIHVNIDHAQLKLKCHHIIYLALIHVSTWRLKPKCKHLSISSITCGNYPHQHGSYSISKCQHLTMSFTWHLSISTWITFKSKCQHLWMSLNGTQSMSTWIICKSMCQQLVMSLYGTQSMSSCVCLRYKNWFPMTKCRQ